jgi:hypothetical protein
MTKRILMILVVAAGLLEAGTARASDCYLYPYDPGCAAPAPPAPEIGRIPRWQLGGHGSLAFTSEMAESGSGEVGFTAGLEGELRIDTGKALVLLGGTASFIGDLPWIGRAAVVFAKKLGGRALTNLTYYAGSTTSGNTVTERYEVYTGKKVPLVYGLMLGASVFGLADVEESEPVVLEAGFAMVGGQAEVVVAPTLTLQGSPGIRWSLQYAFPVGSHPLFFRMGGDHPLAEDGLRTLLSFSVGVGGSMGVSR